MSILLLLPLMNKCTYRNLGQILEWSNKCFGKVQATISILFNYPTPNELSACKKWEDHVLNVIGLDCCVMTEKHYFLHFKLHWKDRSILFCGQILGAKRTLIRRRREYILSRKDRSIFFCGQILDAKRILIRRRREYILSQGIQEAFWSSGLIMKFYTHVEYNYMYMSNFFSS